MVVNSRMLAANTNVYPIDVKSRFWSHYYRSLKGKMGYFTVPKDEKRSSFGIETTLVFRFLVLERICFQMFRFASHWTLYGLQKSASTTVPPEHRAPWGQRALPMVAPRPPATAYRATRWIRPRPQQVRHHISLVLPIACKIQICLVKTS